MKRKSSSPGTDNNDVMTLPGSDAYLRDSVMTATPEQLHLMLYDGAIRFARQGRDALVAKNYDVSYDRLRRAQRIVLEMQSSLNYDVNRDLCTRMASLYEFIYHKLIEANIHFKPESVDDALKILEHQRETWSLLIDKLKKERGGESPASAPQPAAAVQAAKRTPPGSSPARTPPKPSPEMAESTLCIEG